MDSRLLEILVCPLCKGPLQLDVKEQRLCCVADEMGFLIKNDIPILLAQEAISLSPPDISLPLSTPTEENALDDNHNP
jgi:uncharacterized protein YbaR (Trm112 family)